MKPTRRNPLLRCFLTAASSLVLCVQASQAATYQWAGTTNNNWATASNWATGTGLTAGPAPTGSTGAHRININGTTKAVYSSAQGTTTYNPASDRALVIGSGSRGSGTLEITGGTLNTQGSGDVIGNGSGNTAHLIIAGGNYTASTTVGMGIGGGPNAILTLTSGTMTVPTLNFNNTTGTVHLDGGTLAANTLTRAAASTPSGTNTINLNGGTLKARVASTTFLADLANTTVRVKSGGAIIDTSGDSNAGVDVTIAEPLLEDAASTGGGLTKNGLGKLTLSGTHSFTGNIAINQGTLELRPSLPYTYNGAISGPGSLTIAGTAPVLLGGDMTTDITVAGGSDLGGEGSTSGALTLAGAHKFYFNAGTTGATEHFRAGSINASAATVNFIASGSAASGVVVMQSNAPINGTIGAAGSGANFIENSRISLSFNNDQTQLLATFVPGTLTWIGADATNPTFWDTTSLNWDNAGSIEPFVQADNVIFNDSAASFNVAVQTTISPNSVIVNNSANDYTIGGQSIGGSASITKDGTAALTLSSANTFSGTVSINNGTLHAPHSQSLGTGGVTVASPGTLNLTSTANGDFGYTGISTSLSGNGTVNVSLGTGSASRLLNGNNSGFSGTLNIGVAATAGAGKATLLGNLAAAATVNVLPHAAVYISGSSVNQPATLNLNGGDTGESIGQLRLDSGSTWSGDVVLAGDITGAGDGFIGSFTGTSTISGVIGESGGAKALSKVGGGKIISTRENFYTGATNVLGGTFTIQNIFALSGAGTTVANGATLELDGSLDMPTEVLNLTGQGAGSAGALRTLSGDSVWNGNITTSGTCRIEAGSASSLKLTGAVTLPAPGGSNQLVLQGNGNVEVAGSISDNAGGAGTLSSSANGSGIRTLSNANFYTGSTTINGGTLLITHAQALGSTVGGTTVAGENLGGGTLALDGGLTIAGEPLTLGGRKDATIDQPHLLNLSGNNEWTGNITFAIGGNDYNLSSAAGQLTISGTITPAALTLSRNLKLLGAGNGIISGAINAGTSTAIVNLVKRGSGNWTLAGTNTFNGNVTIEEGSLALASSGQLRFIPTANGTTNAVTGSGTFTANGKFLLDLSNAAVADGNQWVLVNGTNLNESYDPSFSVDSSLGAFTETSAGVWTLTDASSHVWTFTESTGTLSVALPAANDYDAWMALYPSITDANLMLPTADPDGDGLTNQAEHAFGLAPDQAASSNPIVAQLNPANGTFSYQRRETSGLVYTIESSTNLIDWTVDPGAQQSAGTANANGTQTVEVTIPGAPLSAPKLFVRVKAVKPAE